MRLWCVMKNGFYMTTGDNQLSSWMKKKLQSTFQSQTCTQIRSCRCLVVCYWSDPLQLFESWWNHCIWEVGSANQWDVLITAMPSAGIGQQNGPNSSPQQCQPHIAQPTLQKSNELGYEVLPHPPYSPDLFPTDYHFFKHLNNFLQGKCFHN